MLPLGYQTQQDIKDGAPDLSEFGDVYELAFGLGTDHPPTSVALRTEFQRMILSQESPPEDSELASTLLRPWPAALSEARFETDWRAIGQVRHVYVLKPEQQQAMIRRWPPSKVVAMDTDYSPFFSEPERLFQLIVDSL